MMGSVNYRVSGNEVELFKRAYEQRLPVMLTGPTGCGKTRLVEYMGGVLGRPVATISCHDDLTSSDLVGRFLVSGGNDNTVMILTFNSVSRFNFWLSL